MWIYCTACCPEVRGTGNPNSHHLSSCLDVSNRISYIVNKTTCHWNASSIKDTKGLPGVPWIHFWKLIVLEYRHFGNNVPNQRWLRCHVFTVRGGFCTVQVGIVNMSTVQKDGYIYCRFSRPIVMSVDHISDPPTPINRTFDLSKDWYLFLSWGYTFTGMHWKVSTWQH